MTVGKSVKCVCDLVCDVNGQTHLTSFEYTGILETTKTYAIIKAFVRAVKYALHIIVIILIHQLECLIPVFYQAIPATRGEFRRLIRIPLRSDTYVIMRLEFTA